MAWIGGALSLGAALLSSDASSTAAGQAAGAANAATNAQLQMFDTQNAQQAPWRQAGANALSQINYGFGAPASSAGGPAKEQFLTGGNNRPGASGYSPYYGELIAAGYTPEAATAEAKRATDQIGGYTLDQDAYDKAMQTFSTQQQSGGVQQGFFNHQFNADDLKTNLAPNYQFQLSQGLGAVKNAGNLQTGLISGNTLKGINDYAQNFAGNAYQQAFNNYTANQSNIFNRLSTIAGLGSSANQQSAGLAGTMSGNIAGTIQNAGAAQAAGTMGSANALSGGIGNALGWYQANKWMQPQTGGGGLDQFSMDNP